MERAAGYEKVVVQQTVSNGASDTSDSSSGCSSGNLTLPQAYQDPKLAPAQHPAFPNPPSTSYQTITNTSVLNCSVLPTINNTQVLPNNQASSLNTSLNSTLNQSHYPQTAAPPPTPQAPARRSRPTAAPQYIAEPAQKLVQPILQSPQYSHQNLKPTTQTSTGTSYKSHVPEEIQKLLRRQFSKDEEPRLLEPELPNVYITTDSSTDWRLRNFSKGQRNEKKREEALKLFKKLKIKVTEFKFPKVQAKLVFYPHEIDFEFIVGRDDTQFMAESLTGALKEKFGDDEFRPDHFKEDLRKLIGHTTCELYIIEVQKLLDRQRCQRDKLEAQFADELHDILKRNHHLQELVHQNQREAAALRAQEEAEAARRAELQQAYRMNIAQAPQQRRRSVHFSGPPVYNAPQHTAPPRPTNFGPANPPLVCHTPPAHISLMSPYPQQSPRSYASSHPTPSYVPMSRLPDSRPRASPMLSPVPHYTQSPVSAAIMGTNSILGSTLPPLDPVLAARLGTAPSKIPPSLIQSRTCDSLVDAIASMDVSNALASGKFSQPHNNFYPFYRQEEKILAKSQIPIPELHQGQRFRVPTSSLPSPLGRNCCAASISAEAPTLVRQASLAGYEQAQRQQQSFYNCQS